MLATIRRTSGPARHPKTRKGRHQAAGAAAAVGAAAGLLVPGLLLTPVAQAAQAIPRATAVPAGAPLPVRSTDAARLAGDFGRFSVAQPNATELRVQQDTARAIVNWDSFNVAPGHRVQFVQPAGGSTLNRIWDANPSVVQGRIQANGEVLLENRHGLIIGPTARVETGRFVATALRVQDQAFYRSGQAVPPLGDTRAPAFAADDADRGGYVSVELGAEIRAASGGSVMLLGPRVVNGGRIETPDGQAVLAAGQLVYLAASLDPAQRGLVVGVKPFADTDADLNRVTQVAAAAYGVDASGNTTASPAQAAAQRLNQVLAERGQISLVGLSIHQNGLLQATTAVRGRNGVIELLAQAAVNPAAVRTAAAQASPNNGEALPRATAGGELVLGSGSRTEVLPEAASGQTQLDSETFNRSRIVAEAERVWVQADAVVRAPSGRIEIVATQTPAESRALEPTGAIGLSAADTSRIVVASGAVLDAAGLQDVSLPMSRNQLSLRLFQNELADAPVQRDGVLYREEIFFDARTPPTLANVAGAFATIARTAEEWSTTGGVISLRSDGAVAVDAGARIDISGGSLRFEDGTIRSSVLRDGSRWVPVEQAQAGQRYDELGNSSARSASGNALWSLREVPGYVQGKDAGELEVYARLADLAGTVRAGVTPGPLQTPGSAGVPQAGRLDIGSRTAIDRSATAAIRVQAEPGTRAQGLYEQPLTADIELAMSPTLLLGSSWLQDSGLAQVRLAATASVTLAAGTDWQLPAGGRLQISAPQVQLDGRLRTPGGLLQVDTAIEGATPQSRIALGAQALLDTSGLWLDGSSAQAAAGSLLNGGSVQLSSRGSLQAADGATIRVSGGAQRLSGSLRTGKAGSITLRLNDGLNLAQTAPAALDAWQARLEGMDFDGGGSLSISGLDRLVLGGPMASPGFGAALFQDGGFGRISLAALGDVRVTAAAGLDLQLRNFLADTLPQGGASGPNGRFVGVGVQPVASRRGAVSLSLAATGPVDRLNNLPGGALQLDAGARIRTEAGGSLSLTAQRQLTVLGELQAPGGSIALTLEGRRGGGLAGGVYEDTVGFDPSQSLWLGTQARLDVSGTAELAADSLGRPRGTVLGGGSISLVARRGYLVAEVGSQLNLRGHAASVWVDSAAAVQAVSRDGGRLLLQSAEGLHMAATVDARAADARATGGSLQVRLTLDGVERFTSGPAYGTGARELRLQAALPTSLQATAGVTPLQDLLGNGIGVLPAALLADSGFADVALQADDRLRFGNHLRLALPRSLTLDAPVLAAAQDSEVELRAPLVALGDRRRSAPLSHEREGGSASGAKLQPTPTGGDGVLQVWGGLVDVQGDLTTQGLRFLGLNATLDEAGGLTRQDGEVRFSGIAQGLTDNQARSRLAFAGELQITAGVTYATTMSEVALLGTATPRTVAGQTVVEPAALGVFRPAAGSSAAAPMSAAGSLSLRADSVRLAGTLHQPFGRIEVQADELVLTEDARLSVSGEGQTLLLGSTVNGRQWQYRPTGLYAADGSAKPVDPASAADIRSLDALPTAKSLVLDAQQLRIDAQAELSAAGGGRLLAWEFVPGVGGTRDVLAAADTWAVLPGYGYAFAPHDAEIMGSGAAATLRPGSRIEILDSGSALAAGSYTLLPARYALLPGAVLLQPDRSGSTGAALALDDGSMVVNARLGSLGAATAGTPAQRWVVSPAAVALKRSRIDTVDAGSLLAAAALRLGQPLPTQPAEGGLIQLVSSEPLRLASRLDLRAAGAAGGTLAVQVRGGRIAIVDTLDDASVLPEAGDGGGAAAWSQVSAGRLSDSGARNLLIGAVIDADDSLAVDTAEVQMLARQQPLSADTVLLAARDEVRVGAGARIQAGSAGSASVSGPDWRAPADAALLVVGRAAELQLQRSAGASGEDGASSAGRVALADGSRLAGTSVQLDGRELLIDPGSLWQTQHLALGAHALALGLDAATPEAALVPAGTTVLGSPLLTTLDGLSSLSFAATDRIDFYGSRDLQAERVRLDAPLLRGAGAADPQIRVSATRIELRNSSGRTAPATAQAGAGRLVLQAAPMAAGADAELRIGDADAGGTLGPVVAAFDALDFSSTGDAVFAGAGSLQTPGALDLRARRITATTGARQSVQAGSLRLLPSTGDGASATMAGSGAHLLLAAGSIEHGGRLELPGGHIEFRAGSGGLRLGPGSLSSAAGAWRPVGSGDVMATPAGRITAWSDGAISLAGTLDVGGRGTGDAAADAGEIALKAAGALVWADGARLLGAAQGAALAGSFSAQASGWAVQGSGNAEAWNAVQPDAQGRLDTLAQALTHGGLTQRVSLRWTDTGALLGAGATLQATELQLSADRGPVQLDGMVDARAAAGGAVRIFAGGDLSLAGRIDARSSRVGAAGGEVTLGSADGRVRLQAGAQIQAGALASGTTPTADSAPAQAGRIVLRVRRDDEAGTVALEVDPALQARQALQAGDVAVEAVRVYEGVSSVIAGSGRGAVLGQDSLHEDALAFASRAAGTLAALGLAPAQADASAGPPVALRASAELRAPVDLRVQDSWNLWREERPGGQPGTLTLRAGGHLLLQASVGDGFADANRSTSATTPTPLMPGPAASLRLVAGADASAADPLAVQPGAAADLRLADGTLLRTSTGSLELAAARDIVLSSGRANSQQAVVMVTGGATDQTLELPNSRWAPQFTAGGGSIRVQAGRDIVGAPANQLFGAWQYKVGSFELPVAWFNAFDAFRQGIGSFGGGTVRVQAGGRIEHLAVVSPTQGLAASPPDDEGQRVAPEVWAGGDIWVRAGGDIAGGTVLLGRGQGLWRAGGAIAAAPSLRSGLPALGPVIGLMDGQLRLQAAGPVTVSSVFNPTVMMSANGGNNPRIANDDAALFFSYGSNSGIQASSQAGELRWDAEQAQGPLLSAWFSQLAANGPAAERLAWNAEAGAALRVLPPQLGLFAWGGPLQATLPSQGLVMLPSTEARLQLVAEGDLSWRAAASGGQPVLVVSDLQPGSWPQVLQPQSGPFSADQNAAFAVSGQPQGQRSEALHGNSTAVVQVHAGGDLRFFDPASARRTTLVSPLPVQISAGGDLSDLGLVVQHSRADQVSRIGIGGSLLQNQTGARITLAGPGLLSIEAGGQIDLGSSSGIETIGNLHNPALPEQGASLRLLAGAGAAVNLQPFQALWLSAATSEASVQAAAEAFADSWLGITGRAAGELTADSETDTPRTRTYADRRPLREQLVDAAATVMRSRGADAAALEQRRAWMVDAVRAQRGLPALAPGEHAAAFESSLAALQGLSAAQQAAVVDTVLQQAFVQAYLAPGRPYATAWTAAAQAAGQDPERLEGAVFDRLRDEVLFAELNRAGSWAAPVPASQAGTREAAFAVGFLAAEAARLGPSRSGIGDIDLVDSGIQALRGGDITLLAPGGQINVGLPGVPAAGSPQKIRGVVGYGASNISAYADGDFQVNTQRVFVVGQGDILIWSNRGNIDAGRGANTAINVPPVVARRQADGSVRFELPAVTTGSGIGVLRPPQGQALGSIGLFAPQGEVLALDAQIRAPGRVTAAADQVRGADNISAGSVAGVPLSVPTPSVVVPPDTASQAQAFAGATPPTAAAAARERDSLLLLELLGLGPQAAAGAAPGGAATQSQTGQDLCEPGEDPVLCEARLRARQAAPKEARP